MQLPYKVIEVNPLMQTELKWSSYKKVRRIYDTSPDVHWKGLGPSTQPDHLSTPHTQVPVLQFDDGEVLVGSSAIMSR